MLLIHNSHKKLVSLVWEQVLKNSGIFECKLSGITTKNQKLIKKIIISLRNKEKFNKGKELKLNYAKYKAL